MANTKKSSENTSEVINNIAKDGDSLSSKEKDDTANIIAGTKCSKENLTFLDDGIWESVYGDKNTRVLFVGVGSIILTYTVHGISSCYIPNVKYDNGKFERI